MNVAIPHHPWRFVPYLLAFGASAAAFSPAAHAQEPPPSQLETAPAEDPLPGEPGQGAEQATEKPADAKPDAEDDADEKEVVRPLTAGYRLESDFTAQGEPLEKDREKPELGGPEDPVTPGEAIVWVPRVIFFPLYLATDFLVRRPLGFVIENIEEHHVVPRLTRATTFGDRSGSGFNGGVLPRLRLERQMRPAVGLEVFLRDSLFPGNDWSVGADTDFRYNVTVDGGTALRMRNDRLTVGAHGGFRRDGDVVFTGIGPYVDVDPEKRFSEDELRGGVYGQFLPNVPGVGGRFGANVSQNRFDCAAPETADDDDLNICGADGDLGSEDDRRTLTGPAGLPYFASGYDLVALDLNIFADTRATRPRTGTGLRGAIFGHWGHGYGSSSSLHFVRHGAELATFLDLYKQRVIGLRLVGELAHPLGESDVPFTELSTLGGHELMRGFLAGTFRGRSTAAATLEYRYPVWSFFDGSLFYEVGNAYGVLFDGFTPGSLRSSFGLGFRTVESRNLSLDLLFALGTTRYDEPFDIEVARVSFGTTWGF